MSENTEASHVEVAPAAMDPHYPQPEIPFLTKSYGMIVTAFEGGSKFTPGGYSYGFNGAETRFSRKMGDGEVSIGFSQEGQRSMAAFHETHGGWRFFGTAPGVTAKTPSQAVASWVRIKNEYINCRYYNLGRPYAGAPAFLAIMNPRTGEQFRSRFMETDRNGEAKIFWENDPQYDYYPCIVRKEVEWEFFPWNMDTATPAHASRYHGEFETIGSVPFNTTYTYVIVEPNRPEFGISGMGHFQGTNVAFIQARWEDMGRCPGHAFYILVSFDRQRGEVVFQQQVTGTEGEFLAYTNSETELHIFAFDTQGREYANNWGVLMTPSATPTNKSTSMKLSDLNPYDFTARNSLARVKDSVVELIKPNRKESIYMAGKGKNISLPNTNFVPIEKFFPSQVASVEQ